MHEHYRDSAALLEHFANLGDTMHAIFETCTASGEILGTPSPALRKALEGGDGTEGRGGKPRTRPPGT